MIYSLCELPAVQAGTLGSEFTTHIKLGVVACICNPVPGRQGQTDPWDALSSLLAKIPSWSFIWRPCLKKYYPVSKNNKKSAEGQQPLTSAGTGTGSPHISHSSAFGDTLSLLKLILSKILLCLELSLCFPVRVLATWLISSSSYTTHRR